MATRTINRIVDANGDEFVLSGPDVSNKLDKDGLGDNVLVQFTPPPTRTNIVTTSKLSVLFGKIQKWFADMGALAFKDTVGASDVESGTYPIDISGNAASATTASTLSASAITSGDLDDYRSGGRRYFCNAGNSSQVSNKPTGVTGAFALSVIAHSGGITQRLYSRDSNYSYIRCYTGLSTWTSWDRISLASNAGNADTVDGYHIVLGSPNGAAHTIFLA